MVASSVLFFNILGSFCETDAGESPAPGLVDGRRMGRDEYMSLFIFGKILSLLFHLQDVQRFLDKFPVDNLGVFVPFVCANPHLLQRK